MIKVGDLVYWSSGRYTGYVRKDTYGYYVQYLDGSTSISTTLKDIQRIFKLVPPEKKAELL